MASIKQPSLRHLAKADGIPASAGRRAPSGWLSGAESYMDGGSASLVTSAMAGTAVFLCGHAR
jgi:hypothetical protein